MVAEETSLENAYESTLTAEMGPTDLVAAVVSKGALTSPTILVIEPDDDGQREFIRFDGTFGGSSFVTTDLGNRYLAGSAAASNLTHPAGSTIRAVATAQHFEDLHDRIDALDHGADLAGLGDDDHPQYHNDSRADTWLGTKALDDLGSIAHDLLTGLGDDDHPQYMKVSGGTFTGAVILDADPSVALGAATKQYADGLITTHEGLSDPHPGYLTPTEGDAAYAAIAHEGAAAGAHAVAIAGVQNGFLAAAGQRILDDLADAGGILGLQFFVSSKTSSTNLTGSYATMLNVSFSKPSTWATYDLLLLGWLGITPGGTNNVGTARVTNFSDDGTGTTWKGGSVSMFVPAMAIHKITGLSGSPTVAIQAKKDSGTGTASADAGILLALGIRRT